jgi:TonB family protein
MPQFPGGSSKLFEFLQKNLRYPQVARDNNIQGTVVISFVVETDGSIGDIRVSRSLSPDCDAEAVRVVSVMPRWTPGEQDGKLVRVQYVLPVKFALSQNAPASARALSDSASRSKKIGIPVAAGPSPEDGVMMMVEEMASFPGGPRKMYEYLNQNLKYPEADRDRRIQGTVALTFVVETDGSIKNIQVARSLSPGCDAEAVRVASMMPKWTPGKHKGEVVRVQYVLPVKFTITAQ